MESSSTSKILTDKVFWLGTAGILLAGAITFNAIVHMNAQKQSKNHRPKSPKSQSPKSFKGEEEASSPRAKKKHEPKRVTFEKDAEALLESHTPVNDKKTFDSTTGTRRKASAEISTKAILEDDAYRIYTVAFTGGPCAGKTTAISYCAEKLKEIGFPAICVPEAATLIFSSGGILNMSTYTPYQGILFQKSLMLLQMSLEEIFTKLVSINARSPCFVLCDRGLMDGAAYLSPEQWEVLLNEMGLYEHDIKDSRYDLVIHLTTAADGAAEYYNTKNNTARSEDINAAIELDKAVRKAWKNHPNYYLITNDLKDFDTKMRMAKDYILKQQGFPINTDFTVKYLMTAGENVFDKLTTRFRLDVFSITDTFIGEDDISTETVTYVRKREHNSRLTFLKGKRFYNNNESYSSTKRNIMWKEYTSYIEMYKSKSYSISRRRCMVVITDVYITFEIFHIHGLEFIIAIIQGSEKFKEMNKESQLVYLRNHLPLYITERFVTDITGKHSINFRPKTIPS